MHAKDYARALIKRWEGCKLQAYPDPATGGDPITIGWGTTGPGIVLGVTWTQEQADAALDREIDRLHNRIVALVPVNTLAHQLGALISFAYNAGLTALIESTLFRMVKMGDWDGAAAQFERWVYGGPPGQKKVMKGLVNRRKDERHVFEGGGL